MTLWFLIILISLRLSSIEACVRTLPPEEVYITSTPDGLAVTEEPITDATVTDDPTTEEPTTEAPVCQTECDISSILSTPSDPATSLTSKGRNVPGECNIAEVTCERQDGKICEGISVWLHTPNLDSHWTVVPNSTGFLECEADGTFSAYNKNGIMNIYCEFRRCVYPPNGK
ncbi:unnamed protein product [Caenorhabditis nigoni]